MTKLIAVHFLGLASATGGAEYIEPGTLFRAREDELHLVNSGAARKPVNDEGEGILFLRIGEKAKLVDEKTAPAISTKTATTKPSKKTKATKAVKAAVDEDPALI